MKRVEVERQLHVSREKTLDAFLAMSEEELRAPITPSEHDPSHSWSALNHLSHLGFIEESFVGMIRRYIGGAPNPVSLLLDDSGVERTRENIMARVHAQTDADQQLHDGDSISDVVRR